MRQFILLTLLALFICGAPPGHAADTSSEYRVKAAYLYNFAKFIRWPEKTFASVDSPLVIGVLGKNPFNGELTPLADKTVRNRKIIVRQFATIDNVTDCHLLYVSDTASRQLRAALQLLRVKPMVTIGDNEDFCKFGGVIQFVTRRDRLRFVINLDVAKDNDIHIDSQLLSLAVEVLEAGR